MACGEDSTGEDATDVRLHMSSLRHPCAVLAAVICSLHGRSALHDMWWTQTPGGFTALPAAWRSSTTACRSPTTPVGDTATHNVQTELIASYLEALGLSPSGSATEPHEGRGRPRESIQPVVDALRAYEADPNRLHNDNVDDVLGDDPQDRRYREKPEHRLMAVLKAKGFSNKEIADYTGYSSTAVGHILRQPHVRQRILDEIKKAGGDELEKLIAGTAVDNVLTLIDIRDTTKDERLKANVSNTLLERYMGRPVQRVDQHITKEPSVAEVAILEADLAKLQDEEKRLRAN